MRYADRADYQQLLRNVRDRSSTGTVICSEGAKGGHVVNVRTPTLHVRVWTRDLDDAIEAARCALQECWP